MDRFPPYALVSLKRTGVWLGALAVAMLAGGCPAPRPHRDAVPLRVELVLPRQTNEQTSAFLKLAREAFPEARVYPALSRLSQTGPSPVLVVVQAAALDPIQWPALAQSLAAGTPILFWGRDPLRDVAEVDLALVSPAVRRFDSPVHQIRRLEDGVVWPVEGLVQSPYPRRAGETDPAGRLTRWVPLAESEGVSETARAWPSSLWIERQPDGNLRSWGWVGLEAEPSGQEAVIRMLQDAVRRLQTGCYILPSECAPASYAGGHRLEFTVRVAQRGTHAGDLRVSAELVEEGGRSVRRVSAPVTQEEVVLGLGTLPRLTDRKRDYQLRLRLESGNGTGLDQMEERLRVNPGQPPGPADFIGVSGPGFRLGRRPLFILGTDFCLPTELGRTAEEAARSALDPEVFDPELARRELARAQSAGVNVLHVRLEEERQLPQLRWLMEEIRPLSLWLQVQVAGLDPLTLDVEKARALLQGARLVQDPVVFALEAGSTARLGSADERAVWADAWREWLAEQFGSLEQAEEILRQPAWRREGQLDGPPDEALAGAGQGAEAVALYRRFMDDLVSRRLGEVRRMLGSLGCRVLLGARRSGGGWPGEAPLDPASGGLHMDFITVDGSGLGSNGVDRVRAQNSMVYARGMLAAKPVIWRDPGREAGFTTASLSEQTRHTEAMLDAVLRGYAAGVQLPRLPGGWRAGDPGDPAFCHADGRWRPAGELVRRFNLRVRREASAPPSWLEVTVDREADPRGWTGWLATRPEGVMQDEVRPVGYNRSSLELAAAARLSDEEEQDAVPPAWLNGEWGSMLTTNQAIGRRSGMVVPVPLRMPLELEVWNSGSARWVNTQVRRPGSIWVRASQPALREVWLPVPDTAPGQRAVVKWTPTDVGAWELRLWSWQQGGFGELLRVKVQ